MTEIPREFPLPEEALRRQRSVLGTYIEAGRQSARRTRRGVLAVAAVILVGGLLVTPAVGIGDRILDLLQGARTAPEVRSPVWSPDGRKIAFVSRDHTYDLHVMNADGSGLLRLTRDAKAGGAVWSPDGKKLASGVYVLNADGSGKRRLLRKGFLAGWSPDGRQIVFRSSKIYVMNADGSDHRTLTGRSGVGLTWSPDGRRIAFLTFAGTNPDYCSQIYVVNADGSAELSLTQTLDGRPNKWCYLALTWSRDGRKIAAVRARWGPTGTGLPEVYVMNADGSGKRTRGKIHFPENVGSLAWSPDGRKILFQSFLTYLPPAGGDVYVVNADGSGRRNLTRNPAHDTDPAWSRDGRKIVFVSNRDGKFEVYVMNADGSGQRRLTQRGS